MGQRQHATFQWSPRLAWKIRVFFPLFGFTGLEVRLTLSSIRINCLHKDAEMGQAHRATTCGRMLSSH